MMMRTGKIGRLSKPLQGALNELLYHGDGGTELLEWLNSQPETQEVLRRDFEGSPISKQNLSAWRRTGYAEWRARQELVEDARKLVEDGRELSSLEDGVLGNYLASVLMVKSSRLLSEWEETGDEGFEVKVKSLRQLCMSVTQLRRGDHSAGRLKLVEGQAALEKMAVLKKGYLAVAARAANYPEVEKAFSAAFNLLVKAEEESRASYEKRRAEHAARVEAERQKREKEQAQREERARKADKRYSIFKETGKWPSELELAEMEKQGRNGGESPAVPATDESSPVKPSQGESRKVKDHLSEDGKMQGGGEGIGPP